MNPLLVKFGTNFIVPPLVKQAGIITGWIAGSFVAYKITAGPSTPKEEIMSVRKELRRLRALDEADRKSIF